jgi:hypothetical protein
MELKIDKVRYEVTDPGELGMRLAQIRRIQFSEVWMQHGAGWPAIGALINGEAAWLMYVRHEGDEGAPLAIRSMPGMMTVINKPCDVSARP